MNNNEIIQSVGLELEFSNINRNSTKFKSALAKEVPGFDIKHDASCETPTIHFAGQQVEFADEKIKQEMAPYLMNVVIGGELASPVINSSSPNWIKSIEKLCALLVSFGETENSVRDSFHVHVNVSSEIPLFVLKNLLRLTAGYESIMFRLGGLGRVNRGEENHFCYQRPYLGNGPPVVYRNNKYVPILNYEDLMNSETREEFFGRYGDAEYFGDRRTRYVTSRYMVTNFYSILTLGSFEFRTANKTLNSRYIVAWTNFCKAFVQKAWIGPSLLDEIDFINPLYKNEDIPIDRFVTYLNFLNYLDDETVETLVEIWETSPTPFFDNIWRLTHLREPTFYQHSEYMPKILPESTTVKKAEFVDIHGLENQERPEVGARIFRLGIQRPAGIAGVRREIDRYGDPLIVINNTLATQNEQIGAHFFEGGVWYGPFDYRQLSYEIKYRENRQGFSIYYTIPEFDYEDETFVEGNSITISDFYNESIRPIIEEMMNNEERRDI